MFSLPALTVCVAAFRFVWLEVSGTQQTIVPRLLEVLMSTQYKSVYPIGDSDPGNLPVADAAQAAAYYQDNLGFTIVARSQSPVPSVTLRRDGVELTLAENGGDPTQASVYIETTDVDAARAELDGKGLDISPVRDDTHADNHYRVFFVRAPDGLCYCLGQKQ